MNNNKTFNFTANNIAQIPFSESQTEYFDASIKVPNSRLCLRVGKATKTWVLHYRKTANGKTKKVTSNLGNYPNIPLGLARDKFKDEVANIIKSTDKFIQKATSKDITFSECADFYIDEMEPSKNEMTIINNAIKELGHMPMKDINKKVVKDFYAGNRKKKQYAMANYKREIVQRIWNYNLEENEDNCSSFEDLGNPAHHKIRLVGSDKQKKKKTKYWTQQPSEAKVKDEQIRPLFDAIELEEHSDKKNLIKLFFYLGQHPFEEICKMRWEQISEDNGQWWWVMEEGFHKTGYEHSVPLHPTVMKIIEAQRGKDKTYVFVSNFRKDNQGNLLPYRRSGFSKQIQRIKNLLEDNTITYQCFRATVTTKLRELHKGHEPSYLMNQQLQGISNRVYTRSEFREQKIAMVNDWMQFIEDRLNDAK